MNYRQMMKWNRKHPKGGKSQYMGFSFLAPDERRRNPIFGGWQFEEGREDDVAEAIKQYHEETQRLLIQNPNLRLVD